MANLGLAPSRSRARDMIARGNVRVNGETVTRASRSVSSDTNISVEDETSGYVSRAAVKLIAALDAAKLDVSGRSAVDLGASTGGFTQVLLERGAARVAAVDVGHGQMAAHLADDPRVISLEKTNARYVTREVLSAPFDLVVSDMSFIRLQLAAEPTLLLAEADSDAVLLVKPQFQVGRDGVGKNGIVTDAALVDAAVADVVDWFDGLPGWQHIHLLPSPITGGDGNTEYLLVGRRR